MYKNFTVLRYGSCSCMLIKVARIMKITCLLLWLFILQVSANTYGQKISIHVRNADFEEVLLDIQRQSGYNFLYGAELPRMAQKVSVSINSATLPDALKLCLANQPFTYVINNKTVTLRLISGSSAPVAIQVTGKVTDDKGMPLSGVSIKMKKSAGGAVTDTNGAYVITVPNSQAILVFTSVGYEGKEIIVGGQTRIDVTLSAVNKGLDEIIVVGYGMQKKTDLTGSIGSIKADDIQKSKSISFMEALQGRLAGVQVTSSSGEPGAAANINIRGANSFASGTQPLYVIDGVQIDINNDEVASSGFGNTTLSNPLAGISPSDIASIEVLKDASATAIFGSRGANGVVIITTKEGKANSSALELNTYFGLSQPTGQIEMVGAQDYAAYRHTVSPTDGQWGTDTNGDGTLDAVKDMTGIPEYNWQDLLFRNALTQSYNVNYSGGNLKTTFATALNYLNQEGLVLDNSYKRYGLSLKINHKATDKLKLGTTINASQVISTGIVSNGGEGVRNYNGLIQNILFYKPVNVQSESDINLDPDDNSSGLGNPLNLVSDAYKKSPVFRIIADVSADYTIIKGLTLTARTGGTITNSSNREFYPANTSLGQSSNGVALLANSNTTNWYQTTTLTYIRRIKQHAFTLLAGFEANSYLAETFNMKGTGFDLQTVNGVDNIAMAKVLAYPPTTNKYKYNRLSEFGRLNYSWKDRYLFTATIRRDGSSKFGAGNKYALFPSAALAWRVINEPFLKKQSVISDLKLRTSFGVTGNDRIPPYQSLSSTYNTFYSGSSGNAELGISPNTLANPFLKWESTYQYDAGLDLELFKGRIALTIDAYLKQTKDLLLQADVPGQTGFAKQWQNLGRVDNKGIEFSLNTINIQTPVFTWQTGFNISFNRNEIKSLGNVSFLPVTISGSVMTDVGRLIVGQPIGTGYGYVFDGIYQLSDFTKQVNGTYVLNGGVTKINGRSVQPGDFRYKDLNGDGIVDDQNDRTKISDSNPKHTGGFSNTLKYKNTDLSVFFQWSYGNDILYPGLYRIEAGASTISSITKAYWDDHWTEINPSNSHASISGKGKTEMSTYYLQDGSYLRLKNVTLGQTLNANWLKKTGIKSCRVYVTVENLLTYTKYKGFDPELASYSPLLPGIDNIGYPRAKTFTFGLNVKL